MMMSISSAVRSRRGRRPQSEGPALDRARLVQVVLEMARAGGVEALNIRAVAQALGVSPRLIYHHVSGKEEMLGLLTDELLRGRMPDLSAEDWETRLRNIAGAVHLAYRDHPGSAAFILARSANRLEHPNALRIREAVLDALAQAGLDQGQREEMLVLFSVVVLGNVMVAESLPSQEGDLAVARATVEAAFARSTDMLVDAIRTASREAAARQA
jgi:TetR/AcrR family tetracycline transcriptional repressor